MDSLVSVRTNIFYTKDREEDAEFIKCNELIFLVEEPTYTLQDMASGNMEVVRNHGLRTVRFSVQNQNLQGLIDYLTELKDCNEKDLK